jgi:hypothetical protein
MTLHCLEKWIIAATFVCPSFVSTAYGFGLGVRAVNGPQQFDNAVRIAFDHAQSGNIGDCYFYSDTNHSGSPDQQVSLASGAGIPAPGNTYIWEVERNKNVITAKLKNSTGGTLQTHTKTYNISTVNGVRLHNAGYFTLWAYGGTIDITDITVSTTAWMYAHIMVLGDSNKQIYPGSNSTRTFEQVGTNLSLKVESLSGINAEIPDMPLTCAIAMQPFVIVHATSSNDKANGISDATRRTRYATSLTTLGTGHYGNKNLILEIPVERNGIAISTIETDINTTYSGYTRANMRTVTSAGGNLKAAMNSGDNIHINASGNTACVPTFTAAVTNLYWT